MKIRFALPYFILLIMFLSCKGQVENIKPENVEALEPATSWFNESDLLQHVKELSSDAYEGRRTGTEGAFKAKTYIIEALSKQGVKPLGAHYEQHFDFERGNKDYKGINILASIKGHTHPEKYIVLSAHYDHEGIKNGKIYNGADDDASGISALIAFAEYFKNNPPKHSVIFAAVDAEELGLVGSKYFVDNSIIPKENMVLNINMDMISRSDKNELFVVGTRYYKQLEPAIKNAKPSGNVTLLIGHDGSDGVQNWTNSSDHASFHKANIPFLYFGVEDHKDYHKPTDDFENIHPEFYQNAVTSIISIFRTLDSMEL